MSRRPRRGPNSRDLTRILLARASARMAVSRAAEVHAAALLDAFRAEIGAAVRGVSPLLLALLEHEGLRLDDLAWQLQPAEEWPVRPRLPASRVAFEAAPQDLVWPVLAVRRFGHPFSTPMSAWHGVLIGREAGVGIAVHVVDHSIEVAARLGGAWCTTLFGNALIEVPGMTLDRMPAARAGRPLEEVLDLPAFRGRGWVVRGASDAIWGEEVEIEAETGTRRYRLPWVR